MKTALGLVGAIIIGSLAYGQEGGTPKNTVRIIGPLKLIDLHLLGSCVPSKPIIDALIQDGAKVQIFGKEGMVCRAHLAITGQKMARGYNTIVVLDYRDGTHAVVYGSLGRGRNEMCVVEEITDTQRAKLREVLLAWKRVTPDQCGECALERAASEWCLSQ